MKVCVPIAKCYEANVRSFHIYIYIYTALHIFTYNKITLKNQLKRHTKTSNNTKTRSQSQNPDNIEKVFI